MNTKLILSWYRKIDQYNLKFIYIVTFSCSLLQFYAEIFRSSEWVHVVDLQTIYLPEKKEKKNLFSLNYKTFNRESENLKLLHKKSMEGDGGSKKLKFVHKLINYSYNSKIQIIT